MDIMTWKPSTAQRTWLKKTSEVHYPNNGITFIACLLWQQEVIEFSYWWEMRARLTLLNFSFSRGNEMKITLSQRHEERKRKLGLLTTLIVMTHIWSDTSNPRIRSDQTICPVCQRSGQPDQQPLNSGIDYSSHTWLAVGIGSRVAIAAINAKVKSGSTLLFWLIATAN